MGTEEKNPYREFCNEIRDTCVTDKITTTVVQDVLASFVDLVQINLKFGRPSKVPGLGEFLVRDLEERTSRNPKTGETIVVPAKRRVVFRPYPKLTEKIQKQND